MQILYEQLSETESEKMSASNLSTKQTQYQVKPPELNKNPILIKTSSLIRNTCTLKSWGPVNFMEKEVGGAVN